MFKISNIFTLHLCFIHFSALLYHTIIMHYFFDMLFNSCTWITCVSNVTECRKCRLEYACMSYCLWKTLPMINKSFWINDLNALSKISCKRLEYSPWKTLSMPITQRAEPLCFSTKAKYVNKAADSSTLGPSPSRSWCLSSVWLHM